MKNLPSIYMDRYIKPTVFNKKLHYLMDLVAVLARMRPNGIPAGQIREISTFPLPDNCVQCILYCTSPVAWRLMFIAFYTKTPEDISWLVPVFYFPCLDMEFIFKLHVQENFQKLRTWSFFEHGVFVVENLMTHRHYYNIQMWSECFRKVSNFKYWCKLPKQFALRTL